MNAYESLPVSSLRTLVRQNIEDGIINRIPGTVIAGAKKEECLAWLDGTPYKPHQTYLSSVAEAAEPASNGNGQAVTGDAAELLQKLGQYMNPKAELDESRVVDLIKEHAPKAEARTVKIEIGEKPAVEIDKQHKSFDELLTVSVARINAMLVGPAGSGKTTAAEKVAEVMNLPFSAISFGPLTMQSQLVGYEDAHGVYHETMFVKAYRDGGVFLGDEIDAAGPAVLVTINMALANGSMSTPVGMIKRHPDFIFIAGANTYGSGADRSYVGRAQLDAATLDRFAFIDWPYDEELEANLAGNETWTAKVREYRRNAENHGLKVVISPRASINGAKLLAAGMDQEKVEKMLIFKGLDSQTGAKIKNNH